MDEQLFPQQQPAPKADAAPQLTADIAGMNAQVTSIATRLKLAEERYANLTKRNQITEESLLGFERDIKAELRALTHQSVELRKHLQEVNTKIDAITAELASVVQKPEFTTLERYLDMWQPAQFITREQAKRLIRDAQDAQEEAARSGMALDSEHDDKAPGKSMDDAPYDDDTPRVQRTPSPRRPEARRA